jgi:hypothetical protein
MHEDHARTAALFEAFQGLIDGTAHCEVLLYPPLIDIETSAETEILWAARA